jgi:alanyl-tRNA synthetase
VTGANALALLQDLDARVSQAASLIKAPPVELPARLAQIMDNVKSMEKEIARLKSKLAASAGDDLAAQATEVNGVRMLAAQLEGADATALRETLDKLKNALKSAAIVLASVEGTKVTLIAGVTADLTSRIKAGELVNHVAVQVGGKGGGRPDMAQAGGNDPSGLPAALASVRDFIAAK